MKGYVVGCSAWGWVSAIELIFMYTKQLAAWPGTSYEYPALVVKN